MNYTVPTAEAIKRLVGDVKGFYLEDVYYEHEDLLGSIDGMLLLERTLEQLPTVIGFDINDVETDIAISAREAADFMQSSGYRAMDYTEEDAAMELEDDPLGYLSSVKMQYQVRVDPYSYVQEREEELFEEDEEYLEASKKEAQTDWDEDMQTLEEEYGEGFEPDDWATDDDEPSEEDIFLQPSGSLGSRTSVSAGGKFIGEYKTTEEAEQAIKDWTEQNQWWPNIWYVDDHGGIRPYSLEASKKEAQHSDSAEDFERYLEGCVILAGEGTIDKNSTEPIAVGIIHDGSGFNPGAAIYADWTNQSEDVAVQAADEILLEYKLKNESEHLDDDIEKEQEGWDGHAWVLPSNVVADIISKDEQASLHISIIEED